jgi:hypothetical protein
MNPCHAWPLGLILTLLITATALASHAFHEQASQLKVLQRAVEIYYADSGDYPTTNESGTWFEKLKRQDIISASNFWTNKTGDWPVDYYGHRLVYQRPEPSNGHELVIRAVGKNGVDDSGRKDDWDAGEEPNLGYWTKQDWPAARRWAAICGVLALLEIAANFLWWRWPFMQLGLTAIYMGLLGGVVLPWGFDRGLTGGTSASIDPRWITSVAQYGAFLILGGGVMVLAAGIRRKARR